MRPPMLFSLLLSLSAAFGTQPAACRQKERGGQARSEMNTGKETNTNANAQRAGDAAASEKRSRTPAQKKIDSQLLQAIYRQRGEAEAKGVPAGEPGVRYDAEGRALVSIRARVSEKLLAEIERAGGVVVSSSERYNDIQARVPLDKLEALAALPDVIAIMPAAEATTN